MNRKAWIGAALLFFAGLAAGLCSPRPEPVVPAMSFSLEAVATPVVDPAVTPEIEAPSATAHAAEATPAPVGTPTFSLRALPRETVAPKRVLIYHTHTYEAYQQDAETPYAETEKWRTADERFNMLRVGAELARLLNAVGLEAVHDDGVYEPPALSSSYARSLEMLRARQAAGERYDLYIDLHRDAYSAAQTGSNALPCGGQSVARLMTLVGKGDGYTDAGYEERPPWEKNLAVAQRLTDALNQQTQGLCKEVRVKSGRFNQHVAEACLLIEVGNNHNTLSEALAAMPYLADAIRGVLLAQ